MSYAYTDQATIEHYLKRSLTTHEAALCPMLIGAVKGMIDLWTNLPYEGENPDPVTRIYDGRGTGILNVDPFLEIDSIDIIDSYGESWNAIPADYIETYPLNSTGRDRIRLQGGYTFYNGVGTVRVIMRPGYGEAPDNIKLCATILAGDFFKNPDGVSQESIEGYSRTLETYFSMGGLPKQVYMLLNSGVRKRVLI